MKIKLDSNEETKGELYLNEILQKGALNLILTRGME